MSALIAIGVFLGSLALGLMASAVLAERLNQLGQRYHFRAGLLGIVTALGADLPEIASAASALLSGNHELGRGVIFGSNIFNIAALFGLSAILVGRLPVTRANLLLNGGLALWVTIVVGLLNLGWLGTSAAGLLLAVVIAPYLALSALSPARLASLPLPRQTAQWVESAISTAQKGSAAGYKARPYSWADMVAIVPLIAVVVATSIAMVRSAETFGEVWSIPPVIVGTFIVATLTGIPNLIAALQLAVKGRGAALSSEAFNSNSLNLIVGSFLPSFFIQLSAPSPESLLALWWLLGMTLAAILIGLRSNGFGRIGGALLLAAYALFAVMVLAWR